MMSTKEVAILVDCSPDDVIVYLQKGIIKGEKKGRRWYVDKRQAMKMKRCVERRRKEGYVK